MRLRYVVATLITLQISGCGGGASSNAPSNVNIGGKVTGLLGSLVLQNNAGDSLTVTANGAFNFPTVLKNGANYAVTILTQPTGPTCVVSNGSGTATADVTNVTVTCTSDPATVYLPITSMPDDPSAQPRDPGLFVVSTGALGEQPTRILTDNIAKLGVQSRHMISAQGMASAGTPYALMYNTVNSSSGDHVWSLNVTGSSTLVPTQLSNLTIPYYTYSTTMTGPYVVQTCDAQAIAKNLADPTSVVLVLALPTDATKLCNGSLRWVLIHATDSPTTTPVSLPELTIGTIAPLYRPDGTLAGIVAMDNAGQLNFYADETFTQPRLLASNVESFYQQQEPADVYGVSANPTYSYLGIQPAAAAGSSTLPPRGIHRIDFTGTISADLADVQPAFNGSLVDAGNLYFTQRAAAQVGSTQSVQRIPADGGPVQTLGTQSAMNDSELLTLAGISGSQLVFSAVNSGIETLSTDAPGSFTTLPFVGGLGVSVVDGYLLSQDTSYHTTGILDVAGNVLQPTTTGTEYLSAGSPVMQVRDIPGGFSSSIKGGGLYVLDFSQPSSPTPVAVKTTAGTPFVFDSNADYSPFAPINSTITVTSPIGVHEASLVYDVTKNVVVPVSLPNSAISFPLIQ